MKKRRTTKKTRGQVKDPRIKARILAETELHTDAEIAAKYGISERSIQRWRAELETDPDLAKAHRRIQTRIEDGFVVDAVRTFHALARRLEELAPKIDEPRDIVIALEKLGDILVQARALPRVESDEEDEQPSLDREGAATEEDLPAARARAVH